MTAVTERKKSHLFFALLGGDLEKNRFSGEGCKKRSHFRNFINKIQESCVLTRLYMVLK